MCGRFANTENAAELAAYHRAKITAKRAFVWRPTWNAAPTQALPVVLEEDGQATLSLARWGWRRAFAPAQPSQLLVNARGEEAAGKPTWALALASRRCIVPATAFYEWHEQANQPYAFRLASASPFGIAGLWEPMGEELTFVLLTTVANAVVSPIHHRMACMLAPEDECRWLDPQTPFTAVQELIKPYPAHAMTAYAVSQRLNSVRHDDADLLAEIKVPRQRTLFE